MTDTLPYVHLRAIEPEDLDNLYAIENDTSLWNVGATSVPYSRYTLYEYIANSRNDIYTDRQVRLMIENEERQIVGIIDLINYDPKHQRAEVGIVIKKCFRAKGYGQAAMMKIRHYALDILHIHQLYACVNESNVESKRMFEKCGFVQFCELKDWLFDGKAYNKALLMQLFL